MLLSKHFEPVSGIFEYLLLKKIPFYMVWMLFHPPPPHKKNMFWPGITMIFTKRAIAHLKIDNCLWNLIYRCKKWNKHVLFFGKFSFLVSGKVLVKRICFTLNANILKGHNFNKYVFFFIRLGMHISIILIKLFWSLYCYDF